MQATASIACLDGTNYILLSHKIRIPTESTQRGHDITLPDFNYIILQKRFVQKLQHIRPLFRAHILINMHTYVGGCVRAGAYNLI